MDISQGLQGFYSLLPLNFSKQQIVIDGSFQMMPQIVTVINQVLVGKN